MCLCTVDDLAFVRIQKATMVKPPAEGEEATVWPPSPSHARLRLIGVLQQEPQTVIMTKVYRSSEDALEWSELASAEFDYHSAFLLEGVKQAPVPAPSEPTEPAESQEPADGGGVAQVRE